MVTQTDIHAYLTMWLLLPMWVCGHTMVSMRVHIGLAYRTIVQGINLMVTQSVNMTMATITNPALMLASVVKALGHMPTKAEYAYTSKAYHMIKACEGMSVEDSILYLEHCESIIAKMWTLPTSLPSKKDDNQKSQHIATLAGLIRDEYKESGRVPMWVDQILAGVKLEEITTTKTAKGKKTNTVATIPTIGAAIDLYADKENESEGASPLIPQQRYTVGGLGIVAKRISNASGRQGSQIIECMEDSLLAKMRVGVSFTVDTIMGYKFVVIGSDKDAGMVYATWHKTTKPSVKEAYSKAVEDSTTAQAQAKPTRKATAKGSTTDIDLRMSKVEDNMTAILTMLASMKNSK